MATPLISFIIPVRDDAERLKRCLASIRMQTGTPLEILVADNGSIDGSPDVARAAGALVLTLPNRPVSQVRNEAARAANGEFIALIDADHTIAKDWTTHALAEMRDPNVWAVGAEYDTPSDGTWVQRMYDRFRSHPPGTARVSWLPSGNLLVRRTAFDEVRGFDESLESCEDVDFCRKIRAHGGILLSHSAVRSVHHGDPRTLASLFFSELWRGRDNIRVSLRERLTWRSGPSVVIPIVNLTALALVTSGLLLAPWGYGILALPGLIASAGLSSLRALRLLAHPSASPPLVSDLPKALLVAGTYDLARSLALLLRVSHATRRKAKA